MYILSVGHLSRSHILVHVNVTVMVAVISISFVKSMLHACSTCILNIETKTFPYMDSKCATSVTS